MQHASTIIPQPSRGLWPAFSGAVATLTGVGIARFAYVPLFPAMVASGWISGGQAGLLGGLNLAGYLAGVVLGRPLARAAGTRRSLHLGMALVAASCLACAWPVGLAWLCAWRAAAGIAGGILMALAGPAVQASVDPRQRGLAGGIVLTGVGCGVVLGAALVPVLLSSAGLGPSWVALAILAAALWLASVFALPDAPVPTLAAVTAPGWVTLCLAYGLSAAGLVPHMVYFGDLVVHGHGYDLSSGARAWLLFGAGALIGPVAAGRAADRWGAMPMLRVWLGLQIVAVALTFVPHLAALLLSAAIGGFAAIGLSSLALARAREIAGAAAGAIWVRATAAFAIAQAIIGLLMAALFARTGSHAMVFGLGFALSVLAMIPAAWPTRTR